MLVDSFLEYMKAERNCSKRTEQLYRDALRQFECFYNDLGEDLRWETISSDVIREWVVFMMDEKSYETTTVNLNLSALRSFYHYLVKMGRIKGNPMKKITGPKNKKALPAFVKVKELESFFDNYELDGSFRSVRDWLVVLMFYSTGIRRAELLGLADKDVMLHEKQIKVTGKRNKQRLVPFGADLEDAIKRYLEVRNNEFGISYSECFFLNDKGCPMTPAFVGNLVKRNLSGVTSQKKKSPHVLRHTFATAMLNNGADLRAIQELLGHSSLMATEIYTHLSFEELKSIYENAHPRS